MRIATFANPENPIREQAGAGADVVEGQGRDGDRVEAPGAERPPAAYFFTFGRFKKKPQRSLDWVIANRPKYVTHFLCHESNLVYRQYPDLALALYERGYISAEKLQAVPVPPGVDAGAYLAATETTAPPPEKPPGMAERVRRKRKRKLLLEKHNCTQCGGSDHNDYTCVAGSGAHLSRLRVSDAYNKAGQEAKKKASDLYTNAEQVSEASRQRPSHHARAPSLRTYGALWRAPPLLFAKWQVEDGLFYNLKGRPCFDPRCRFEDSVLGPMVGSKQLDLSAEMVTLDITRDTVCYRCCHCRWRWSVVYGHPLFLPIGHGSKGATPKVLTWWSWNEDKTATTVSRELGIDVELVSSWFREAELVAEHDALARQRAMKFGGRGDFTTEFEVDETCWQSWRVPGENGEPTKWYFFVTIGMRMRGCMDSLWIRFVVQAGKDLPLGVTEAVGEKAPSPPIGQDFWLECAADAFGPDANLVQHSDEASTYENCTPPGVVDKHAVNHSDKEYARWVEVLRNVSTGERTAGITGSMCIDRSWRSMKTTVGKSRPSCKTEAGRVAMRRKIRAAQWKHLVSTGDRWQPFCAAAKRSSDDVLASGQKLEGDGEDVEHVEEPDEVDKELPGDQEALLDAVKKIDEAGLAGKPSPPPAQPSQAPLACRVARLA